MDTIQAKLTSDGMPLGECMVIRFAAVRLAEERHTDSRVLMLSATQRSAV